MTPEQLAKDSEHSQQMAFFCALVPLYQRFPALRLGCFAIPNGGERNIAVATKLKAEGVKEGVLDVFVSIPTFQYHGLYIEFKRPKTEKQRAGKLSDSQLEFAALMISQNYAFFLAYDYRHAIDAVLSYLSNSFVPLSLPIKG